MIEDRLEAWQKTMILDGLSITDKQQMVILLDNQVNYYNDHNDNNYATVKLISTPLIRRVFGSVLFKEWVNYCNISQANNLVVYTNDLQVKKSVSVGSKTRLWDARYLDKINLIKEEKDLNKSVEITANLALEIRKELDYEVIRDLEEHADSVISSDNLFNSIINLNGAIQRKTSGARRVDWIILSDKHKDKLENLEYYETHEGDYYKLGVLNERWNVYIMDEDFDYVLMGPSKSAGYFMGFYVPFNENMKYRRYYKTLLNKRHYAKLVWE